MHHIPVDRGAGDSSYATSALRYAEGGRGHRRCSPRATISRSFTVQDIKNGAIRMAQATKVPLIPMALWGSQAAVDQGQAQAAHPAARADHDPGGASRSTPSAATTWAS
ncbi:hypothetical protein [Nonomuraea dietziae]|uniref:hypothetical protein n=1 Tax=Nonomuraea dietziae TaxID=65515 RepID=UPI0031E1B5B2